VPFFALAYQLQKILTFYKTKLHTFVVFSKPVINPPKNELDNQHATFCVLSANTKKQHLNISQNYIFCGIHLFTSKIPQKWTQQLTGFCKHYKHPVGFFCICPAINAKRQHLDIFWCNMHIFVISVVSQAIYPRMKSTTNLLLLTLSTHSWRLFLHLSSNKCKNAMSGQLLMKRSVHFHKQQFKSKDANKLAVCSIVHIICNFPIQKHKNNILLVCEVKTHRFSLSC